MYNGNEFAENAWSAQQEQSNELNNTEYSMSWNIFIWWLVVLRHTIRKKKAKPNRKNSEYAFSGSFLVFRSKTLLMPLLLVFGLPYHALDDLFEYLLQPWNVRAEWARERERGRKQPNKKQEQNKNVISILFHMTKATCFFIMPHDTHKKNWNRN